MALLLPTPLEFEVLRGGRDAVAVLALVSGRLNCALGVHVSAVAGVD